MRVPLVLLSALLFVLAVGLLSFGCGGSGDDGPTALSEIPTATPPDTLPDPLIVSGTPRPAAGRTYTVQPGDNPSLIAERFGVPVESILEANGIVDPTGLVVGQELIIPGAEPEGEREVLGATATPRSQPQPTPTAERTAEGDVYIVQADDIPETIAAQFGITAEELMAANDITDPTSLQIGQELVIPTPRPTPAE